MHMHTDMYIYTYISQHVDPSNINALGLGGGTRLSHNPCLFVISIRDGKFIRPWSLTRAGTLLGGTPFRTKASLRARTLLGARALIAGLPLPDYLMV